MNVVMAASLLSTFGKRRMYKDINKLSGHYIVCGAGRVGAGVIRDISRSGHDLVVIEGDESIADRLLTQGQLVLMGDATSPVLLSDQLVPPLRLVNTPCAAVAA